MRYIKGLDTFRAFAVIFVIIQHWGPPFNDKVPVGKFIEYIFIPDGGTGVYMFFVLSGFLITSILLKARTDAHDTNRFTIVKNFFARRVLRIFPLYYLVLFILLWVNYYPDLKDHVWYFLTYTSNIFCYRTNSWGPFSQSWTLAIEEQFYLLWPWLMLFIPEKYLKYVFISAIVIGITTTWWIVIVEHHIIPYLPFNCYDAFGLGGFYAYSMFDEAYRKKFEKLVKIFVPAVLVMFFLRKISIYNNDAYYLLSTKKIVDSFLSLWVIMLIVNNRSLTIKKYLLENRFLNFTGRISYCIYLIHPYVPLYNDLLRTWIDAAVFHNASLSSLFTGAFVMFWIDLGIVITIAWLSYICIERPILSLKRAFKYNV